MTSRPAQTGRAVSAAKVLVIVFIALALACAGVVTYVGRSWKGKMASGIRYAMIPQVSESNLPDDQKTGVIGNLSRLADDFEADRVSFAQLGTIVDKLEKSRFFDLILIEVVESRHIETIRLGNGDREAVSLVFDRFERGICEETINTDTIEEVLAVVTTINTKGNQELTESLTGQQLHTFVDLMREAVDRASIPVAPYQVDFAGDLQRVLDQVLGAASTMPYNGANKTPGMLVSTTPSF